MRGCYQPKLPAHRAVVEFVHQLATARSDLVRERHLIEVVRLCHLFEGGGFGADLEKVGQHDEAIFMVLPEVFLCQLVVGVEVEQCIDVRRQFRFKCTLTKI